MDGLDAGDNDGGEGSWNQWSSLVDDDNSAPEEEDLDAMESAESAEVIEAEAVVEERAAALHSIDDELSSATERTELLEADLRVKNNILVAARRHLAEARAEER